MNEHAQRAINALEQMRSDDLYRARIAFGNYTPDEMNKEHGESGRTRAEILAGYETRETEVAAAIAWIKEKCNESQ